MTGGEQLDEISYSLLKGMGKGVKQTIKPGGSNALGVKSDATSAGGGKYFTNNARLLARILVVILEVWFLMLKKMQHQKKPAGPKPTQDMNLNRQGGPSAVLVVVLTNRRVPNQNLLLLKQTQVDWMARNPLNCYLKVARLRSLSMK